MHIKINSLSVILLPKSVAMHHFTYLLILILLTACQHSVPDENTSLSQTASTPAVSIKALPVQLSKPLQKQDFQLSTQLNGKIEAWRQTEIRLKSSGAIIDLPISNGQFVRKGSRIAKVEDQELLLELDQMKIKLKEAQLAKIDLMVTYDGIPGVDTSLAPHILERINIKSGLSQTQQAIKQLEYQLSQKEVLAPFDGLIANLKIKQDQQGRNGELICQLINPKSFEVIFHLIEQEALAAKVGDPIELQSIVQPQLKSRGRIRQINPLVNDHGLVSLKASVQRPAQFIEGMNVNISLEKTISNVFVVPRSALVFRGDQEVIFTFDESTGEARWNTIDILYENEEFVAFREGLRAGAQVIIEGNIHLNDGAKVVAVNRQKEI
jgi:RND family efflux transporter MFP subunit